MQPSASAPASCRHRLQRRMCNRLDELAAYAQAVDTFGEEAGWDAATAMQINLVLEELIVNAVEHGYGDGREGYIEVSIDSDEEFIDICIEDDGDPFDPFSLPPPDLTLNIAERPIGGLGIHLVRSYMDDYAYCRIDGRNRITLHKRLPAQ